MRDFRELADDPIFAAASVIYTYLLPGALAAIEPMLFDAVERGARLVTFYYHFDHREALRKDLFGYLRLYARADAERELEPA